MTGRNFFTVDAQWALQGKTPGRDGYRVLACSSGGPASLSAGNFTEAIGRFSMGTPETLPQALPQVTVSYLTPGVKNHLALAIHRFASDAQAQDGQLMARDDDGRPVVVTSYYCVPYAPVAEHGASYQALYEAFAAVPLHPENGPVLQAELPLPPDPPAAPDEGHAIDPLAAKTAALLLSGRPVCVLGALNASMAERLAFIDAVMALLPYGFRARMTAATWTRATNENHRFRLFFSGARRDAKEPDHVVAWGRPEQAVLTRNEDWYVEWLETGPVGQKLSLLAGRTHPRSLANKNEVNEVFDVLDEIDSLLQSPRRSRFSRRPAAEPDRKQKDLGLAWDMATPGRSPSEQLLLDCASHMEKLDAQQLSAAIKQLNAVKADVIPGHRDRYQELIKEYRLFRHDEAFGDLEVELRKTLLKIAFVPPLSYEDYCLIEDGISEAAVPDSALLQLIEEAGLADNRVKAITYRQLPGVAAEKKLTRWYASADLSADRLLNLLALDVQRPRHTRILCDVTIDYLRKMSQHYDPRDIERVLRQHSYLARKLQDSVPGQNQYQIDAFGYFLKAAYPGGLTRSDISHVMNGTNEPLTLPFLAAVHLMAANSADADLARHLYVHYSFMVMGLETATCRELEKLISPYVQAPGAPADATQLQRVISAPQSSDSDPLAEGGRHRAKKPRSTHDGP